MARGSSRAPETVPRGFLVRFALGLGLVGAAAPPGAARAPAVPSPASPPPQAVLGTYVRGPDRLVPGTPAALRVATHWATSESETGPWAAVDVELRLSGRGRAASLYRGRTDAAGLVDARFQVPAWPAGRYSISVDARAGARRDTHAHELELAPGGKLLLESDKPLYQPTQVIHLRALGERLQDGRPLAGEKVVFEVTDPRGNRVFREARALSRFGVAAADFALADEILLGTYRARAALEGGDAAAAPGELELRVERYALPKFKVALATDRAYYAPGQRAQLSIEARYFFGKPVAGGTATVQVALQGGGASARLSALHGRLDGAGKTRLELDIPGGLAAGEESTLRLTTDVVDAAQHHEQATREVPVTAAPVRLEVVPEAGVLLAGLENRVWVVATLPDGTPAADAPAELRLTGGEAQRSRTNRIGIAEFRLRPPAPSRHERGPGCGYRQAQIVASFKGRSATRCFTVDVGGLLLRSDRALYPAGAPIEIDVSAPGADGSAYVDVVKDGQTVDTVAVALRGGRGHATLPADARRFGTLALRGYRIAPDGQQVHDARLIYVEHPGALRVEARPESQTFRPGESGRIRLHVVDAQSGAGVQAALGVVMVDEALLALRAVRPGAARVYFTLAAEASRPGLRMKALPGGYTVERLVDQGTAGALEQEAARVLLAGAAPPWAEGWQIDPWALRRQAADEQRARLDAALPRYGRTHQVGERVPGSRARWRWRHDLIAQMIADGALPAHDARDPWGRRVGSNGLGSFDEFAQSQLDQRLTAIYRALDTLAQTLAQDPQAYGKRAAVVIAAADLERLVADGKLERALLIDPWGNPFRLEERKKPVVVGHLRSRFVIASAGPDGTAKSGDDRYALDTHYGGIVGAEIGEAFGAGGLGLAGFGRGGGGSGYGTIGLGRMGTIGHGGGAGSGYDEAGGARVRQSFPETMLWRPEVVTDAAGNATLEVAMADSVTTWRLAAEAIAADGRLGQTSTQIRVFQDFFVDLDLPPVLTQHDELSVPVAVYNYLKTTQRVTLALEDARWFARTGAAEQSIDLAPSQVGVRYFGIRVGGVGKQKLLVRATGSAGARDAIEKSVDIFPDGVERALSFQDRLGPGAVRQSLDIPPHAIADASVAQLKIYPALASHVIEGLDSMLRMPGGCFEQTSSSTYPNALILDYLRRTGKATPAVEKKAREYLAMGYQKLLSFEVRGGGFSWFGDAPANKILTAYGLQEFADMARVYPVDRRVIERTQAWLAAQQRPDGSFAPDTRFINEGATNRFNHDATRITAYIALALKRTGADGPAATRAAGYVRKALAAHPSDDAYTLALAAELFAGGHEHGTLDALLDRLWQQRKDEPGGKTSSFTAHDKTPTYGDGKSGTVETTALAAQALLAAPAGQLLRVDRAIGYLLGAKDSFGNWYSTQATILALKSLLAYQAHQAKRGRGTVQVAVDGTEVAQIAIDPATEALQVIDLGRATAPGRHAVELRYQGTGEIAYQLVGRYFEPRTSKSPKPGEIAVSTRLDRTDLAPGATVQAQVRVEARTATTIDMPIVTAGLPPGFDVDGEALEALVRAKTVQKVQRTPREVIFYLHRLEPGRALTLPVALTARFPVRVQVPAATAYEYYRPERRAVGLPLVVTVRG